MKAYFTIFVFFILSHVIAQKMPEVGMNVRITASDKTTVAEIRPTSGTVKTDPLITYYWYGANAIHETQGGYSGHLLNGIYNEYFPNKNLKTQGTFSKGIKTGTWKNWNENGTLHELVTYKNGRKEGNFQLFDDTGNLTQSGNYRHDKLNGPVIFYSKNNSNKISYKDGQPLPVKVNKKRPFWQRINIFKKKSSGAPQHAKQTHA